jgi:methionyl-tRNA formyltransferase
MLKTVFFGTPAVAVPFLERLAGRSKVLGVVCSPDKPAGRGYENHPPEVKPAAQKLGLPVFQPPKLKDPSVAETIAAWGAADVGIVVAYGKLIPRAVFDLPRHGLVNVHFSLLPRYRGAAPVQWALINGESRTGVTLFRIEESMDSGPVFLQAAEDVRPDDDSASLRARLVERGLPLLDELLVRLEAGPFEPTPQAGEPTLAPILKKEDGLLRWDALTARQAADLVRGAYEWPGAYTLDRGEVLRVRRAEPRDGPASGEPGAVVSVEKGLGFAVRCRDGNLLLRRVQSGGKKEMDAWSYWNGARLKPGDRLGA